MSDELTNALAEAGEFRNISADINGKLLSWSDALERGKQAVDMHNPFWLVLDHIVCSMRELEHNLSLVLNLPPSEFATLDDYVDAEYGEVIVAAPYRNPYPLPDTAQGLIGLPAPNFYPSDRVTPCPVCQGVHPHTAPQECGTWMNDKPGFIRYPNDPETVVAEAIQNHPFQDGPEQTGEACTVCGHSELHWIHDIEE